MLAHIKDNREQSVEQHLRNVAYYCRILGEKFELEACAELSGWLHDIGKMTTAFDTYIRNANRDGNNHQKGPDHSTAGAVWITQLGEKYKSPIAQLTAQIIAIVIMGHHGGLIDVIDLWGESPYINRLNKLKDDASWANQYKQVQHEMQQVLDIQKLQHLFDRANEEIQGIFGRLKKISHTPKEQRYYCGVVCKMLYSCLIDADRYDTATFMDGSQMKLPRNNQTLWEELTTRFEDKINQFPAHTEINLLRRKISESCYLNASKPKGVYTLNCPTGSGKTMASLRFALHHAKKYHKERIFYIIPFITITEQNTAEIKKILSSSNEDLLIEENILELHSAKENESSTEEMNEAELVAERLEHPMIFTTMVRFLNIFFGSGTRNIRAAHQFANSVIIFDEIQTLSPKCIAMFNLLLNFLSELCNATIVLSTATQPLLNQTPNEVPHLEIEADSEISGCTLAIYNAFKRTEIIDKRKIDGYSSQELSELIWMTAREEGNVLAVFNTKASVTEVYDTIKATYGEILEEEEYEIYVLTTQLYPKHRKQKIDDIRNKLKNNKHIIVLSTQLIEAGVDISFKAVYRSLAGLDSVIQSAGRCNRHGENGENQFGKAYVVNPNFEVLGALRDIKKSKEALEIVLELYKQNSERFANDLSALAATKAYFAEYYRKQNSNMTYKFKVDRQVEYEMYDLLSDNKNLFSAKYRRQQDKRIQLTQSFKSAGNYFKAIDEHGKSVIIPHREGKALVLQLISATMNRDKYKLLHKLQAYTVNLSEGLFKELGNAITYYENLGIYVLNEAYYDEVYGVSKTPIAMDFYNF